MSINEQILDAYQKNDIEKLRKYSEQHPFCGKNFMVDEAVEDGNLPLAKLLMTKCNACPSLYAVQMAVVNGNYSTANSSLSLCPNRLRNDTDIKKIHYNYKTQKWADCIPEKFRY